jgi:phage shock protein E
MGAIVQVFNMNKRFALFSALLSLGLGGAIAQAASPNPNIDYKTFLKDAQRVEQVRASRRLSEADFLKTMNQPGVILLDARNPNRYAQRHIKGAINLDFTEFTAESLSRIIPTKDTKILIYCNNNFTGSPEAFAMKAPPTSLNISTYVSLTSYGYSNIYELAPTLDIATSKLAFAGTEVTKGDRIKP